MLHAMVYMVHVGSRPNRRAIRTPCTGIVPPIPAPQDTKYVRHMKMKG